MSPLVSIILPVLNGLSTGPGWFERSVFTLVNQDYPGPIEVIVIDDGSTDGTADAVRRWASDIRTAAPDRTIVLVSQARRGVTVALNAGLAIASGEFVARQDADDFSDLTRIGKQASFLRDNEDVGLVASAVRIVRGDDVTELVWYRSAGIIPRNAWASGNPVAHGSIMVRSDVLGKVGWYDPEFRHAQDYDLTWRVAKRFPVVSLGEPLYFYRLHGQRVTGDRERLAVQRECAGRIQGRIRGELARG